MFRRKYNLDIKNFLQIEFKQYEIGFMTALISRQSLECSDSPFFGLEYFLVNKILAKNDFWLTKSSIKR